MHKPWEATLDISYNGGLLSNNLQGKQSNISFTCYFEKMVVKNRISPSRLDDHMHLQALKKKMFNVLREQYLYTYDDIT
jgi:hypothetical protein